MSRTKSFIYRDFVVTISFTFPLVLKILIRCLTFSEYFYIFTLTIQPHQKIRFLEFFFWILNVFAIVSNFQKKNYFLSKPPKITFRTPKLQRPIKPFGNIFERRDPNKPPLNWSFPTKWYPCLHISLFCYSCAVHNNLA